MNSPEYVHLVAGNSPAAITVVKDVRIHIPLEVYHKMLSYARASSGEISGFGKTRVRNTAAFREVWIEEVRIFKQTVTHSHTELDNQALTDWYLELIRLGEDPGSWNLWWHSHNDFDTFFSGVDTATISKLIAGKKPDRMLYSVCINKFGELSARADSQQESQTQIRAHVEHNISPTIIAQCKKEVKKYVNTAPEIEDSNEQLTDSENNTLHETTGSVTYIETSAPGDIDWNRLGG